MVAATWFARAQDRPAGTPRARENSRRRGARRTISAEAREMSEALRAVADQTDRLDAAMIPHLEVALEAGKAVT